MEILLAVAIATLAALTSSVVWAVRVFSQQIDLVGPPRDSTETLEHIAQAARERDELERRIDQLTQAVAEGIERVDRAEKRIRKSVTSARKLVRENGLEHPAIEAEYEELRERDAEPIEGGELQLVPEPVEEDRKTGIPGLSPATLAAMRGG